MEAPGALRLKISGRPFDTKSQDGKAFSLIHRRKPDRGAGITLPGLVRTRTGPDENRRRQHANCATLCRSSGYSQQAMSRRCAGHDGLQTRPSLTRMPTERGAVVLLDTKPFLLYSTFLTAHCARSRSLDLTWARGTVPCHVRPSRCQDCVQFEHRTT